MSKFKIELSMKNIKILKHSLEQRIEKDKDLYEVFKKLKPEQLTEEGLQFIKDHEGHLMCLDKLIEEIGIVGYMHGRNIFGEKYNC